MTEVVIVLPGIMGSELWDGKERVWPGTAFEAGGNHDMPQLLKPDLRVGDILRRVLILKPVYVTLLNALKECGFYERSDSPTLYSCPYDWRKDGALAAEVLAKLIEKAASAHNGSLEITLIGHSMGGLVSRYYLESGQFDTRAGYDKVRRLITLATPHDGTPIALLGATGKHRVYFLSAEQVRQLSNDPNFPALYQVMPPESQPFVWDAGDRARLEPVNIYKPDIAKALGLSKENMAATVLFRKGLDLTRRPSIVKYFFFCGTQQATVCEVRVRKKPGEITISKYDEDKDAGDGVIPTWNAAHPEIQTAAVGAKEHYEVFRGRDLLRLLAKLLGKPDAVRFESHPPELESYPPAELALRESVITAGERTSLVLSFEKPVSDVKGQLMLAPVTDERANVLAMPSPTASVPLAYHGAPMHRITVDLQAPDRPGLYRVSFVPEVAHVPLAQTDWVVQFP